MRLHMVGVAAIHDRIVAAVRMLTDSVGIGNGIFRNSGSIIHGRSGMVHQNFAGVRCGRQSTSAHGQKEEVGEDDSDKPFHGGGNKK